MFRKSLIGLVSSAALISSAYAADRGGLKDEPIPAGWAGFYLGVHVGGVWGTDDVSPIVRDGGVFPRRNQLESNGDAFGGSTVGYNFQSGNFVFGIEADGGPMNIGKSHFDPGFVSDIDRIKQHIYGDVTGRVGYTFWASGLVYAKGGFAVYDGEGSVFSGAPGFGFRPTDTFTGWTAGGGVEYMFTPAWSVKAEYLHFDFGSQNSTLTNFATGAVFSFRHELTADTAKVGINFHWPSCCEPLK